MLQFIHAHLLTPSGWADNASVLVKDGKIYDISNGDVIIKDAKVIDASGLHLVPGGIDMHCHGAGGYDFLDCTEQAFRTIINIHMQHGTTSILPTLASCPMSKISEAAKICSKMMQDPRSPIVGLHLEGPYFNPSMAGGQQTEYMCAPNPDAYEPLIKQYPCIRRWDASPEIDGVYQFGQFLRNNKVIAGIAHTSCGYLETVAASESGFSHVTHFYNAMQGFHKQGEYKTEGLVESAYLMDDLSVEVIADGIHVPPTLLKLVHKLKGVEKTCLVTDALRFAECTIDNVDENKYIVEDGVCKLADRSALAGSVATMDKLIKTCVKKAGIPLEDAIRMASETPARILGILEKKGQIDIGKDADLVLINDDIEIKGVWSMGRQITRVSIYNTN